MALDLTQSLNAVWIGLHYLYGSWQWVASQVERVDRGIGFQTTDYSNWAAGEPAFNGYVGLRQSDRKWYAVPTYTLNGLLCELYW